MTVGTRIQLRRDSAAAWTAANPVLASGEQGIESDTQRMKRGDGVTAWNALPYVFDNVAASATFPAKGEGPQSLWAVLPNIAKAATESNDVTPTAIRIVGLGSSVGLGATLTTPSVDAPSAYLSTKLSAVLNRLGNLSITHTNGSVNGTVITSAIDAGADYSDAETTAGGTATLLSLAYGMNDGTASAYHAGQTYPGVYSSGAQIAARARAANTDLVIFTTPHPRIDGTYDWSSGLPSGYPQSGAFVPTDDAAGSVVSVVNADGVTVNASYRHLRVNQALRRLAAEFGAVLIDAEKYWLQAVATHTQASLFNGAETVHPNDLGHQLSYHAAIDEFVRSLKVSGVVSGRPRATHAVQKVRSSTDIAVTANTWTDLDTTLDLPLDAAPGDLLEIGLSGWWQDQAEHGFLNAMTHTSGGNINSVGAYAGYGVPSWRCAPSTFQNAGGSVLYTAQVGDIENGRITFRLTGRTLSGVSKTIEANSSMPLSFWAKNLR